MTELKICGIWYCNDPERAYKLNITDKIVKLESNLKLWRSRNLTFEGKSLIIKTFGISQLVYGLQVLEIKGAYVVILKKYLSISLFINPVLF